MPDTHASPATPPEPTPPVATPPAAPAGSAVAVASAAAGASLTATGSCPHGDGPPDSPDLAWMAQALAQARAALPVSAPNPPVGCVIVRDGQLLGAGHTQRVGGPHAEVMAMADARQRGHSLCGATAYVTLEPCAHHGRTPPCADALVREQLARVVVALHDPNPLVAGQGSARLRAAGIDVLELPEHHPQALAAREIKAGFLSRMTQARPWVRLKVAGSLDGRTALPDGRSQWITGPEARADGQHWRARASVVLTGIGTVLDDDPQMNVRALDTPRQPWRAVLDSQWRLPLGCQLLQAGSGGEVHVFGLAPEALAALGDAQAEAALARRAALLALAAAPPDTQTAQAPVSAPASAPPTGTPVLPRLVVHDMPAQPTTARESDPASHPHVDLRTVLARLAALGCNELHLEAGARLNAAFIMADLVDEYVFYVAPKLIGVGRPLAALPPLPDLAAAPVLAFHDVRQIGADLRILARQPARLLDRTRAKP